MTVLLASTLLPMAAFAQDDPWADVRGTDGLTPAGITTQAKPATARPTTARPTSTKPTSTKPARAKPAATQPLATTPQPAPVAADVVSDLTTSSIPAPDVAAHADTVPAATTTQRARTAFVAPLPPVRPMPYDAPVADPVREEPLSPQDAGAGSAAASVAMAGDVTLGATTASVTPPVPTQTLSLAPPAPTTLPAPATPAAASLLSWGGLDLPGGLVFSSAIAAEAPPEQAAATEQAPDAIRNVAPNITPPPQQRATAAAPVPDAAATPTAPTAEAAAPASPDKAAAQDAQASTTPAPDGQPADASSAEARSAAAGVSGTESSEAKVAEKKASEANSSEAPAAAPTTDTKAAPEAPPAPPIYRALRQLQRLQDRMARGEPNALDEQNALLIALDLEFRSVDVSAWKDPSNARALVLYVLSGGSPKTVRSVLANGADPGIDPRLVRGALAYVEGREADAIKDLGEIDARALPASLAGQVALAQAALWVRRDQAKAAVLLDQARVLAPGTLVEEGALRRAILIAAQGNDLDSFERLTAAYLGRFRHSVYAGNFRQRFAAALTRMSFIDDPALFHRIEDVLRPIEPEGRRDILLVIAQGAVVQGKTAAAVMAAERVLKSAPVGSLDAERASLYRGAAMAASATEYETAARQLRAISRDRLSTADLQLLDTALAVVTSIEQSVNVPPPVITASTAAPEVADKASAPEVADKASAPGGQTAGSPTGGSSSASKDSTESLALGRARDLLDSTGKLLAEAPL